MSQGLIVASDGWLTARAADAQTLFNTASFLHLYHSTFNPSPGMSLATLSGAECTFDTYSVVNMAGTWGGPHSLGAGHWAIDPTNVVYPEPIATGDTVWGLWVDDGSGNLLFVYELLSPISFVPGSGNLTVAISFEDWARSVLP